MRKLFFSIIFAYICLFSLSQTLAQEDQSSIGGSAALAGATPQVGETFGGVSMVSITLAATIISSLLAFALEDGSDTTPATESPASTN